MIRFCQSIKSPDSGLLQKPAVYLEGNLSGIVGPNLSYRLN
ncbi:hypothetical protein MmTuc01_1904 [Methanosarcina mazei Tuc01]|uniref:Uncharacterized protein n=1 Tax=Methanosarcina mazei Tuc01 TaxID=1236903 RepID=M1QAI3_METMZ|nr:hypothetical protein MmTuc01_1904 [Methanosarcina mazei Tuc01]